MEHYVGIDVSLEQSSVFVTDRTGKIVREAKLSSEPEALSGFFGSLDRRITLVGMEAGLYRSGCMPSCGRPALRSC